MRWFRISAWVFAGLLALLICLVAFLLTADLGRFKATAETQLSDLLGRELRIDGPLHAHLGADVEIYAEDVHLRNPDWAEEPDFVAAKKIAVSVSLQSLWNPPVIVRYADIDGVVVNAEVNESRAASWDFENLQSEEEAKELQIGRPSIPVVLNNVNLTDTRLSLRTPRDDDVQRFHIRSYTALTNDDVLTLDLEAALNDVPVNLVKTLSPASHLESLQDVQVSVTGNVGDITIESTSAVDDIVNPMRPTVEMQLSGPSAEYLTDILQMERVTSGELRANVSVKPDGDEMKFDAQLVFGEFNASSEGQFQNLRELDRVNFKIAAQGPSVGTLLKPAGIDYPFVDPFRVDGSLVRSGSSLTVLPSEITVGESRVAIEGLLPEFPGVASAQFSAVATGPDFGRFNRLFGSQGRIGGEFTTRLDLSPATDGGTLVDLDATAPDIRIQLNSQLTDAEEFQGSTVNLRMSGDDISAITTIFGLTDVAAEAYNAGATVELVAGGFKVGELSAMVGDEVLRASGFVPKDRVTGDTELTFSLHGTDLSASILTPGFSSDRLPDGGFRVSGELKREADRIVLHDVFAEIGDNTEYRLGVDGFLTLNDGVAGSQVQVEAHGDSLAALAELFDAEGVPDWPFDLKSSVTRGSAETTLSEGLFEAGEVSVSFGGSITDADGLEGSNINLQVSGPRLADVIPGQQDKPVFQHEFFLAGNIFLESPRIRISDISARLSNTELSGEAAFQADAPLASGSFDVEAGSPDLYQLFPAIGDFAVENVGRMRLTGSGEWQDGIYEFNDVDFRLGGGYVKLDGTLELSDSFERTDLEFESFISNVANLSRVAGRQLPDQEILTRAKMSGSPGKLTFEQLAIRFGESDLSGDIEILAGERPNVLVDLRSDLFDIEAYANPEEEKEEVAPDDGRLIPAQDLPFDWMSKFDANVAINIGQFVSKFLKVSDVSIDMDLENRRLDLHSLKLTGQRGGDFNLTANLVSDPTGSADFAVNGTARGLVLGFLAATDEEVEMLPAFDVDVDSTASGKTVREMAASLDGHWRVIGGSGKIRSGAFSVLMQDFVAQVLNTLNPFSSQEPYTEMICTAILVDIEDGQLSGHPMVVQQTDKLNIFGNADVNLDTERLVMTFETVPQRGLGIGLSNLVNPYIQVTGTLANPTLGLNPEGVIIEGGVAVATAGLSVLAKSFRNRFLRDRDACGVAIRNADEARQEQAAPGD